MVFSHPMHLSSIFLPVLYSTVAISMIALLYMFFTARWLRKQKNGTIKMQDISKKIAEGAIAFLKTEYTYIAIVIGLGSLLIGFGDWYNSYFEPWRIVNYVIGAGFSGCAGILGMRIATLANSKTAQAARTSLVKAFQISFMGGSVMGIGVVAFALLGLSSLMVGVHYFLFGNVTGYTSLPALEQLFEVLTGFALGAETIALFARVAGGIYTKAADVGADIVGKIEVGIPEDDPRNPATIADNVGDNVGDVAGMGADLFGSYVSTLLVAMVLGMGVKIAGSYSLAPIMLPMAISALGLGVSLVACLLVRLRHENASVQGALNLGNLFAVLVMGLGSYFLVNAILPEFMLVNYVLLARESIYKAILIGLAVGFLVSFITEYFTTIGYKPVNFIVRQSQTGAATNLLAGLSVGMFSTVLPMLVFAGAIYIAYLFAGFYGVAIAAVGMMSTTSIQLAIDAFGPIADNAGGIAEMAGLPEEVRARTDRLDAVGNTTAATGKGFAIASAALTSLSLLAAFGKSANLSQINLYEAKVLAACFVGAMIPFLFSGLVISAVGKAALQMVEEVRSQFQNIPGLKEGKAEPAYDRCIAIATRASLKQMLLPGLIALGTPVVIGVAFGASALGAFLASLVVVGTAMALFQCNAGGAWDNAKKAFEKGIYLEGMKVEKGTKAHEAAIVGDTVGDPFKDTSGPAMNILIKLSIIVALMIAPYLVV